MVSRLLIGVDRCFETNQTRLLHTAPSKELQGLELEMILTSIIFVVPLRLDIAPFLRQIIIIRASSFYVKVARFFILHV